MPWFARVVTAPIGVGIVVTLLWLLLNGMPGGQGGPGRLEQHPWPLSSLAACVTISAALACLQALVGWWRTRRQSQDLTAVAARLSLGYQRAVNRADLAQASELRVFGQWHEAWNRLSGRFEGVPLDMIDFTSVERAQWRHGSRGQYNSRTVVSIRLEAADWPVFEIHPRGPSTWMWDLLGCRGVRFRFRNDHLASSHDRDALTRFNRKYRLFIGVTERLAELAGGNIGVSMGKTPAQESEVADRFSLGTLRRFAQSRGWTVESCGTHVAFWHSGKIIPAGDREAFLREVIDLYRALAEPAKSAADANLAFETTEFDQAALGRSLAGLIAGALAGMIVAMAICVPLLIHMPFETAKWFVLAWPILGMGFMALGAYIGTRLTAGHRSGP